MTVWVAALGAIVATLVAIHEVLPAHRQDHGSIPAALASLTVAGGLVGLATAAQVP